VSAAVVGASATQSPLPPRPPVTVIVTEPPGSVLRLFTVRVGAGAIVKGNAAEIPPPDVAEETVTCAVPIAPNWAAETDACSDVALTNVVGRSWPFHCTTDEDVKPLPLTAKVNDVMPTAAAFGDSELRTGVGLLAAVTEIDGLVAAREYVLFRNNRNSYVPGVVGIGMVHDAVVTPVPTYFHWRALVFGSVVAANASQSPEPPRPLVSVAVTLAPVPTLVALTAKFGDEPSACVTVTVCPATVSVPVRAAAVLAATV
jgi:hypothetical protein